MTGDDLIHKARQGDRAAVEALFQREWKPIYRLVYRALGDRVEAQDITQEVFIRAMTSLDRFQPTATPFAGYLAVIARNLLRDRWRRRRLTTVTDTEATQLASTAVGPEQAALIADEHMLLEALLAPLPPDYRSVIQLRVLEERSTDEVAAIMNRSPGAVRVLQHRAIATLRIQLQEGRRR